MDSEPKCDYGREVNVKFLYIQKQLDSLNGRVWKLIWSLLTLSITLAGCAIVALLVR